MMHDSGQQESGWWEPVSDSAINSVRLDRLHIELFVHIAFAGIHSHCALSRILPVDIICERYSLTYIHVGNLSLL